MKALTCLQPGSFAYTEQPKPVPHDGEVLLKILRVGICGTDLHAYEGTQPFFSYPRVLGHELSGELVGGDIPNGFQKGEIVTFIPYYSCGKCIACRAGKSNCCTNLAVCGVHIDGGMCEYYAVPNHLLLHGNGLSPEALALTEPLAIGAHGVWRTGVQPGEMVVVVGAGPIGLGVMEFAKIAGGKVIALDLNEDRLAFCSAQGLADFTVNVKENPMEQVREITSGDFAPAVIDATGSLKAVNAGIHYLAHGGRYVLVGLQKGDFSFSHPEFHKREASLISSRNATKRDFQQVLESLKSGSVNPEHYITHQLGFGELADSFPQLLDPGNKVIKAMVKVD